MELKLFSELVVYLLVLAVNLASLSIDALHLIDELEPGLLRLVLHQIILGFELSDLSA